MAVTVLFVKGCRLSFIVISVLHMGQEAIFLGFICGNRGLSSSLRISLIVPFPFPSRFAIEVHK